MHWIFVLTTQRKKEASQRFSNLALISVTWQQSTLCVERWLPPVCPKEEKAIISWALPELQSLSSHHLPVSTIHQCPNIISHRFGKCWFLKTGSSVPTCTQTKTKEKAGRKLCPYKVITAAKLNGSSVKDQLWGEKLHNTIKHLLQNTMSNVFDCDSPGSLAFLTCCTFIEVVSCVVVAQI